MLDEFCGSKFWDSNLTWYTENPKFTPCFERTVFVWVPCIYLWIASLLEIYYILNSKERNVPWNFFNISKLVFTSVLVVLKLVDMGVAAHKSSEGQDVFPVDYYSPLVMILTLGLSATLTYYNRKYGLRASGVLFFFWLLLILAGISQFRSEIIAHSSRENEYIQYSFVSYMIYYVLIIIMFVLNCFADQGPKQTPYKDVKNLSPEFSSSIPRRLTFSWFDPLALTGFRRTLVEDDLWSLNARDSSVQIVPRFHKFWQRSLRKRNQSTNASFNKSGGNINFKSEKSKQKIVSILPALGMAFGGQLLLGAIMKIIIDLLMFIPPQLLKLLIDFTSSDDPMWRGYLYAVALFLCATVQTTVLAHYFMIMYRIGMGLRTAIVGAVYKKSLKLSNLARKESTVGEIVNLMSVDAYRFLELMPFLNMIWSAPLQIALCVYFLWVVLGPSVLAGLAVMILLIPLNGVIANKIGSFQTRQMKQKDERVKLMNEILNGIKVLKMYAWEPSFEEQITKIRNKEMHVLKQTAYLNAFTAFVWTCTPFLVSLTSFACFVLIDENNVLDSKKAFVALSLFNILRFPLSMLPHVLSSLVQTAISVKRLNKFMNADELEQDAIEHDPKESNPLIINKGDFSWDDKHSDPILKNINLEIPKGSLVAVVGAVGSGKSSLISAFLGEMTKISGRVNTNGSTAYVPQQAWILNATVQENILFGKDMDKAKYNNVIRVCALKMDLDMLLGGDQTEIGEKGINLSGGQKQRISLARAVYNDADNYFLDDPLSAVDSHVGKHIFEKVIGPNGLLGHKTRLWVTNNISYLAHTDMVVVLRDGEVSEVGTYEQLIQRKGAFAEYLVQHLNDTEKGSTEELDEISKDLEKLGSDYKEKLHRARSISESASESDQIIRKRGGSVQKDTLNGDLNNELKQKSKIIEIEKSETGKVKWSVYKQYLKSVGLFATGLTLVINLSLQGFVVGSNFWLAKWSNEGDSMMANGTIDPSVRDRYLGVYGALGAGQSIASYFSFLVLNLACWKAAKILHAILLGNVMKSPLQFFEVTPLGRILSRFSKDIDVIDTTLPTQISDLIYCSAETLSTIFVISVSTPMFMSVIIPIGILYYMIQRYYVATSRQLKRIESVTRSPIYSHFGETVSGVSSIRAYGVTERFMKESEDRVDYNQSFYYPSCVANRWLSMRLEMIGNLIIFFAAMFAVLSRETVSSGIVGLSITYSLEITQTLNWLVRMSSEIETNIVAVERIKEYAETKQEAAWTIGQGPDPTWPQTGALELDGLTIGYRSGDPAIKDITCNIAPREKIGIVGRTGAGKSTLTLGLFRIVEAMDGRITIDGVDVSKIGLHQLRSRITIIPQDPVLFSGTLRMNLDPFDTYSDDEIWRSLEHAHLHTFVQGLDAGLLHEIAEGGENLSLGQRQLVCLARALLRKTPLLVLDEATAAVDLETDDLIQKTIRSEFATCTVLTIAHRLNTIMDSTRVMVLDKGQLREFAPPEQLLQDKNSIFYGMAKDAGLVS